MKEFSPFLFYFQVIAVIASVFMRETVGCAPQLYNQAKFNGPMIVVPLPPPSLAAKIRAVIQDHYLQKAYYKADAVNTLGAGVHQKHALYKHMKVNN